MNGLGYSSIWAWFLGFWSGFLIVLTIAKRQVLERSDWGKINPREFLSRKFFRMQKFFSIANALPNKGFCSAFAVGKGVMKRDLGVRGQRSAGKEEKAAFGAWLGRFAP